MYKARRRTARELNTTYVTLGLYGIKPEKDTVIPIIPKFISQN
jgi:hypothetical protein